jgi:hypothetical protein
MAILHNLRPEAMLNVRCKVQFSRNELGFLSEDSVNMDCVDIECSCLE